MGGYKVTREALRDNGFFETGLGRRLAADPIGLLDVGARWGISAEFAVAAPLFSVLAFEPDPDEAPRVAERSRSLDWAGFQVEAKALGPDHNPLALNLYSRANNSSIRPVSADAKSRYSLGGFELTDILLVPASPLDAIVFNSSTPPRTGEVIKLDTQGAELDIMHGGARTLVDRTMCLITEVHFFQLYKGAPFFAEIDQHLRGIGFTFIGFSDFQHRSSKRLDKRTHWSRERVFQADAIYFRDPLNTAQPISLRRIDVAILMAVLLGFFDLALEWATVEEGMGVPTDDLVAAIEAISAIEPGNIETELAALIGAIRRHPGLGHVLTGKFIDSRRDLPTFHDIPAPPEEP
jgi:FkbM family methyltransferase